MTTGSLHPSEGPDEGYDQEKPQPMTAPVPFEVPPVENLLNRRMAKAVSMMELPEGGLGASIPRAPSGYQTCNVHDGRQDLWAAGARRQVNHLVAVPTSGPTLCGLTRFGKDADLPGWSMGGGVCGPTVEQVPCRACWEAVP